MEQIIFICTGNTCRSPMAEGFFRACGGEQKTGLRAASAGLYTQDGLPATDNALKVSREWGVELAAHRSHALTAADVERARYLVCMTGSHYDALCERYPDCADKVFMLLPKDVDDPFGGGLMTYRRVAKQIDRGVKLVIAQFGGPDGALAK